MESEKADAMRQVLTLARARRAQVADPGLGRLIRVRAGVTQADVAGILGVDRATVSRWETGDRAPRGDLLAAYRALLDRLADEGPQAA